MPPRKAVGRTCGKPIWHEGLRDLSDSVWLLFISPCHFLPWILFHVLSLDLSRGFQDPYDILTPPPFSLKGPIACYPMRGPLSSRFSHRGGPPSTTPYAIFSTFWFDRLCEAVTSGIRHGSHFKRAPHAEASRTLITLPDFETRKSAPIAQRHHRSTWREQ
ncbi:hypothetical protein BC826DRAFT_1006986 [Russula brevipes]|nr:hypothetical protein BC826DRAFT_1006986 [Russula brevipes]